MHITLYVIKHNGFFINFSEQGNMMKSKVVTSEFLFNSQVEATTTAEYAVLFNKIDNTFTIHPVMLDIQEEIEIPNIVH